MVRSPPRGSSWLLTGVVVLGPVCLQTKPPSNPGNAAKPDLSINPGHRAGLTELTSNITNLTYHRQQTSNSPKHNVPLQAQHLARLLYVTTPHLAPHPPPTLHCSNTSPQLLRTLPPQRRLRQATHSSHPRLLQILRRLQPLPPPNPRPRRLPKWRPLLPRMRLREPSLPAKRDQAHASGP